MGAQRFSPCYDVNRFAYLDWGPEAMYATDDCEMGFSDNNRDPDFYQRSS
jgi:hypothetical protein